MLNEYDFKKLSDKIENLPYDLAMKLIYENVKIGRISLKQFKYLIDFETD